MEEFQEDFGGPLVVRPVAARENPHEYSDTAPHTVRNHWESARALVDAPQRQGRVHR
jgi:hypothetical protein